MEHMFERLTSSQIYNYYGQYSYSNVNQSVNPQNLQIVGNVLSLLTGWLAICKTTHSPEVLSRQMTAS